MSPATADGQVRDYLEAVRARLGDLDPEAREHLLSDTEASLLEAAEDEAALPLEVRLGPPDRFARELRAAAGLPEPPLPDEPRLGVLASLAASRRVRAARALAHELAPVWWFARAFVVLTVLAQLSGDDWSARYPVFTSLPGEPLGWILLLAAIAGSVRLGRRERAATGRWPIVVNVACALAAVWVVVAMVGNADRVATESIAVMPDPAAGLAIDGVPVSNVYPYDRAGRLLQDVRLYDDRGKPLEIRPGEGRPRRVVEDPSGAPQFNAFPIRYFEPGTARVDRPRAGSLRRPPSRIATPRVGR